MNTKRKTKVVLGNKWKTYKTITIVDSDGRRFSYVNSKYIYFWDISASQASIIGMAETYNEFLKIVRDYLKYIGV